MEVEAISELIETAIRNLFESQPDIFTLTAESGQTEWNLCQHLASEIHALLPDFAYDIDLKKPDAGDRRPDIVFHKRGTHEQNFLVVEVKRDNPSALAKEMRKIETYWFQIPYSYLFGSAININSDKISQFIVRANPLFSASK